MDVDCVEWWCPFNGSLSSCAKNCVALFQCDVQSVFSVSSPLMEDFDRYMNDIGVVVWCIILTWPFIKWLVINEDVKINFLYIWPDAILWIIFVLFKVLTFLHNMLLKLAYCLKFKSAFSSCNLETDWNCLWCIFIVKEQSWTLGSGFKSISVNPF